MIKRIINKIFTIVSGKKNIQKHNVILSKLELLEYKIDNINKGLLSNKHAPFFTMMPNYKIKIIIEEQLKTNNTYSQYKEDLVVKYIFNLIGIKKPSYLDIGAHSPSFLSNTKLLYDNGSRGINIEPNKDFFPSFEKEREGDININCGITLEFESRNMDYYQVKNYPSLNTFSKEQVNKLKFANIFFKIKKTSVKVININNILDEYKFHPNFISIDVEGLDFDIINSLKAKHLPEIFCIEINNHGIDGRIVKIDQLLFNLGYFTFANIGGNTLFVQKNLMSKFM